MNFKTLNCIWKLKKVFLDLSRIEISTLLSFVFSLKFSLNLILRCIKPIKIFVYEILIVGHCS